MAFSGTLTELICSNSIYGQVNVDGLVLQFAWRSDKLHILEENRPVELIDQYLTTKVGYTSMCVS